MSIQGEVRIKTEQVPDRVGWLPRLILGAAASAAALLTIYLNGSTNSTGLQIGHVFTWTITIVIACPMLIPDPEPFRQACFGIAIGIAAFSVILWLTAVVYYLPGAGLMLLARYVCRKPNRTRLVLGWLGVLAALGMALYVGRSYFTDTYVLVQFEKAPKGQEEFSTKFVAYPHDWARGLITQIGEDPDDPRDIWDMRIKDNITSAEREELENILRKLPHVKELRFCNARRC